MSQSTEPPRRAIRVEMTPQAIARRMRELAELFRLGTRIASARRIGKVRDLRRPSS